VRDFGPLAARWLPAILVLVYGAAVHGQSNSRADVEVLILRAMDSDHNGYLDPREISAKVRPHVDRYARARQLDPSGPLRLNLLEEAVRAYYRDARGAAGSGPRRLYAGSDEPPVRGFGQVDGHEVPGFGDEEDEPSIRVEKADLDRAADRLWTYDRNRDGFMDRREAREGRWRDDPFRYDRDRDDRLSQQELAERYAVRRIEEQRWRNRQQQPAAAAAADSGDRAESDEDARRTAEEKRRREEEERRRLYRSIGQGTWRLAEGLMQRYDKDRSGKLDYSERRAAGITSSSADTDGDQRINRVELALWLRGKSGEARQPRSGQIPEWFAERDRNNNGQIEMAEFADEWTDAKAAEFAEHDSNGDGVIVPAECLGVGSFLGGSYSNRRLQIIPARSAVRSEIEVGKTEPIADLDVRISITHTLDETLDAFLEAPGGERIELFTGVGGSDDHFDNTVLDDEATRSIVEGRPPFAGRYQPEAVVRRQTSLRHFYGKSIAGTWTLIIQAERSERPAMLHGWALIVKPLKQGSGR